MKLKSALAAASACAATMVAAQAGATVVTFNLGDALPVDVATTFHYDSAFLGVDIGGETYQFNPNGLSGHTTSDFTAANIYRDATGVGVCNAGETLGATAPCTTVDTQNPTGAGGNADKNEALAFTFDQAIKLSSITVSGYSATSTFSLWTVGDGGLLAEVYHLNPITGAPGPMTIDLTSLNLKGTNFAVTNVGGNDNGYHVGSVTVDSSVPEPASWALMIMGFGSLGAVLRRRKTALVAAR